MEESTVERIFTPDPNLRYYSYSVFLNPFTQRHPWGAIEAKAGDYFIGFLNENDYGDLIPIRFNFLVENAIDIDKQDV